MIAACFRLWLGFTGGKRLLQNRIKGVARHRLPGQTFDSILQEALTACETQPQQEPSGDQANADYASEQALKSPSVLPVVLSPDL